MHAAAIDEDGKFVRLFPIPFRSYDEGFRKWQWIEARVTKARSDPRAESYKIDIGSLRLLEFLSTSRRGWEERWALVKHLVSPSLHHVMESGASIGLIKPREYRMEFKPQSGKWSADERAKLFGLRGAPLGIHGAPKSSPLLEKMDMQFRYVYRCQDDACSTLHDQMYEDWEICESWRKWKRRYPDDAVRRAAIIQKYVEEPKERDNLYFFVGTLAGHPKSWVVIGHARPVLDYMINARPKRLAKTLSDGGAMALPGISLETHQGDLSS